MYNEHTAKGYKITDIKAFKSKPRYLVLHDLEEGLAHYQFCKDMIEVELCVKSWLKQKYEIIDIRVIAIGNISMPKLKITA